jgi:hypothetical protein
MMLKKILIQLLVPFVAVTAYAQDTTINKAPKTEIEKFSLKVGSILKKEFINLYSYTDKGSSSNGVLKVQVEIITDAASAESFRGLVFSTGSSITFADKHPGFIDEKEVPNLIKFLDFLETLEGVAPNNYTEYNYNFEDLEGFSYYQPTAKNDKWIYGFQTDQYYSESIIRMKIENIQELKNKIKNYFKL